MAAASAEPDCSAPASSLDDNDAQLTNTEDAAVSVSKPETEGEFEVPQPEPEAVEADASQSAPVSVPLTPPKDCVQVTPDGGVLKKILEPGETGAIPSMHARCLIHYVGYLSSNGDLFMDTRKDSEKGDPIVVVAGRNTAAQETGLCLAAATMTRGEKALVYIQDPSYGYGKMGSFSFPCVPPESQLVYEVEMIGWESIDEADNDQNRGGLLFEERLERAERRREVGNKFYKEGRYKEALAKYALALSYMDEDFMYQLEGHYLDKAEAVKLRIHLNMAAAQLNTGDYNTAIYNCGQVLNIEPNNVKALFRRGKARHALGRTEEAKKDLEDAIKIDPNDKAIIAELNAVKATEKKEQLAQKSLYRGVLKPSRPAGTSSTDPAASPATPQQAQASSDSLTASKPASSGPSAAVQGEPEILPASPGPASEAAAAGPKRVTAGKGGSKGQQSSGSAKGGRKSGPAVTTGRTSGLVSLFVWLWSLLLAAVMGGRRHAVGQRANGRGR